MSAGSELDDGLPKGRLPKPTPIVLKPFKRFIPEHQLYRAQCYHTDSQKEARSIKEKYPSWSKKPEFVALVNYNRLVGDYLQEMYDQPKWDLEDTREVKLGAKAHNISAKRSSQRAEQDAVNRLVDDALVSGILQDESRGRPSTADRSPAPPVLIETTTRHNALDPLMSSSSDMSSDCSSIASSTPSSTSIPEGSVSAHPSVILPNLPVV